MLTITTGDAIRGWKFEDFEIGAGKLADITCPEDIVMVTIDGEELLKVLQTYQNIPTYSLFTSAEINYYGDMAKFIVGNLIL